MRGLDAIPGYSDLPFLRRVRVRALAALQARLDGGAALQARLDGGAALQARLDGGAASEARAARDGLTGWLPERIVGSVRRALAPVRRPGPRAARLPVELDVGPPRIPSGPPAASIVIPTRGARTLGGCLAALAAHTEVACEVIVVDDAAPRPIAPASPLPDLRVVRNASRRGFVASANRGAALARAPVLVFLNDDAVVAPGWLPPLLAALERPRAGLVGPASNDTGDAATEGGLAYADLAGLRAVAEALRGAPPVDVDKLSLFCAAIPRALFEALGGLDEGYGLGLFEDDELCMTIRHRGRRVTLVRGAFVHHHGSATFGAVSAAERIARFEIGRHRFESRWGVRWRAPATPRG